MGHLEYLVKAADGNGTAIMVLDGPKSRNWYVKQGNKLLAKFKKLGAEQAGFLILGSHPHFEMAGGEFCGNAPRAAGVVLSLVKEKTVCNYSYTMSGFSGMVNASIRKMKSANTFNTTCVFPEMKIELYKTTILGGQIVNIADLGGIVHVIIDGTIPESEAEYKATHKKVMSELCLGDWDAVGVVWRRFTMSEIVIDPVVWVKKSNTFFYETSCGSASIAVVATATGMQKRPVRVYQPTGKPIIVEIAENFVSLKSEMEVCYNSSKF
jgi:diaminopimelate epimerase